jgi:hypothetical protein
MYSAITRCLWEPAAVISVSRVWRATRLRPLLLGVPTVTATANPNHLSKRSRLFSRPFDHVGDGGVRRW